MSDDLVPRLRRHLERRAAEVEPVPDAADLDARISERRRRSTRGLAAALAVATLVGPVAGWAVARGTEADVASLTAGGGDPSDGDGARYGDAIDELWAAGGLALDYIGPELPLIGERTTEDGLRLSARLGETIDPAAAVLEDPCAPLGFVRVGVAGDDITGVVTVELLSSEVRAGRLGVTGAAEGRPAWVVVVRAGDGSVEARFPNGAVDHAEVQNGMAVLAARAEPGRAASDMLKETVVVVDDSDADPILVSATGADGGECGVTAPTMPPPGEPPADEERVRAEVAHTFVVAYDGLADERRDEYFERPDVWREAQARFRENQQYVDMAATIHAEVQEVVFTAPDRASVRFTLLSDTEGVPEPGERIGEAVLIDGTWKVSIETSCGLLALSGVECVL